MNVRCAHVRCRSQNFECENNTSSFILWTLNNMTVALVFEKNETPWPKLIIKIKNHSKGFNRKLVKNCWRNIIHAWDDRKFVDSHTYVLIQTYRLFSSIKKSSTYLMLKGLQMGCIFNKIPPY